MYETLHWLTFTMLIGSRGFTDGGGILAGLVVVWRLFTGEGPFLTGLTAFFLL